VPASVDPASGLAAVPTAGPDAAAAPAVPIRRGDAGARITRAALDLFERQGYAATTVDAITERAGVARRTFFHHFASKDAVVFPDHEAMVARVQAHLDTAPGEPVEAIAGGLRIVLTSYLADPELALRRYQLTRSTPELREREIAWVQRYQLLFSRYLDDRYADIPQGAVAADVVAAGLVAVHNHVLRQWLKRGGGGDVLTELDDAVAWFDRSVALVQRGHGPRRIVVAVFDDDVDPQELLTRVRDAGAPGSATPEE
jgi:AcrR family transcriptional regulator